MDDESGGKAERETWVRVESDAAAWIADEAEQLDVTTGQRLVLINEASGALAHVTVVDSLVVGDSDRVVLVAVVDFDDD